MNPLSTQTARLTPFGVVVHAGPSISLAEVSASDVHNWIAAHRLLVIRGMASPTDEEMMAFCRGLGTILEWEFGAVNDLKVRSDATNYLYTNRAVPFHWDGAFAARAPHYIFFHCDLAPPAGSGGETLFCDTTLLLQDASDTTRGRWQDLKLTYSTERVVHYGGRFTAPLIDRHPIGGESILRYAEPVRDLNPVDVFVEGLPLHEQEAFFLDMATRLRDPAHCIAHAWMPSDIVIADNHALLHGRNAFSRPAERRLQRVNVL